MHNRLASSIIAAALAVALGAGAVASTGVPAAAPAGASDLSAEAEADLSAEAEFAAADDIDEADMIPYPAAELKENLPAERPGLEEDFYTYVNYDQIAATEIPEGRATTSSFNILNDLVTEQMQELLTREPENHSEQLLHDIYAMTMDMDARDEAGWDFIVPYVEMIENASTTEELLQTIFTTPYLNNQTSKIILNYVDADLKDCHINTPAFMPANLSLEDSAEYEELTDYGQNLKDAVTTQNTSVLEKYGYDDATIQQMLADYDAFETDMAQYIYDVETSYRDDYFELIYNPYTQDELLELAGDFPLQDFLDGCGYKNCNKYIVYEPDYIAALGDIFCEDNLDGIKAWAIINTLTYLCDMTDSEALDIYCTYENMSKGTNGRDTMENMAVEQVNNLCGELAGNLYADAYFTAEAKADVESIVYDLLDVYRDRLANVDWMSDETKAIAIEKLDSMGVYIAYPEEYEFNYDNMTMDPEKSLAENEMDIVAELYTQMIQKAGTEVNNEAWGDDMGANVVNAFYNSTANGIFFPAAILQDPFYDPDGSISANMGAIGSVIGHEITHAFDTTGSQFDKDGNMTNWWTDEDRAAFDERAQKVGQRYAAYKLLDGNPSHMNADLVIGETVADLGGMSAALQIVREKAAAGEEVDYNEFFEKNAVMWFALRTKELEQSYLIYDPHAMPSLRVNVNISQFDEFYDTYDVQEGDFMYTAPEDRLVVW